MATTKKRKRVVKATAADKKKGINYKVMAGKRTMSRHRLKRAANKAAGK